MHVFIFTSLRVKKVLPWYLLGHRWNFLEAFRTSQGLPTAVMNSTLGTSQFSYAFPTLWLFFTTFRLPRDLPPWRGKGFVYVMGGGIHSGLCVLDWWAQKQTLEIITAQESEMNETIPAEKRVVEKLRESRGHKVPKTERDLSRFFAGFCPVVTGKSKRLGSQRSVCLAPLEPNEWKHQ